MLNTVSSIQTPYNPLSAVPSTPKAVDAVTILPGQEFIPAAKPAASKSLSIVDWILHPFESLQLNKMLKVKLQPGETFGTRLAMYRTLQENLSATGKKHLYQQLKKGRLTDNKSDDGKTTLDHLYAIATNKKAAGLDAKVVLEETVRLINEPQTITQRFGTLTPQNLRALMDYYNSGAGPQISQPIDMETLRVTSSATCVASSVMYYMAYRSPSEFTRHIAELSSPRLAFVEKAAINEIAPEDPSLAAERLNEYGIPATPVPGTNNQQYWVTVNLPQSGLIRAVNQQRNKEPGARGVVEALYQGALTKLAAQSYDPGLDMRVNPDGTLDYDKGLEEERKTLMESIIKDNGGVMSVVYQFTAAGRDNEPYLMGYYRSFDQTLQDIISAIDIGEDVLVGIVTTDRFGGTTGRLDMKHELTITGYEKDPKTGEVYFITADSDDDNPKLVKRSAREMIPMIHHAGFPAKIAHKIWNDINTKLASNQYLIPDQTDAARYNLLRTVPTEKQQAFLDDYQRMIMEEEAAMNAQMAQEQQASYPGYAYTYPQQAQGYAQYPNVYYSPYYSQPSMAYYNNYANSGYYSNYNTSAAYSPYQYPSYQQYGYNTTNAGQGYTYPAAYTYGNNAANSNYYYGYGQ